MKVGDEEQFRDEEINIKLININEIFQELIGDAKELTKDLMMSIGQYMFTAAFMFLASIVYGWFLFFYIENIDMTLRFLNALLVIVLISVGMFSMYTYFKLKRKYYRLFEIQREINLLGE